MLDINDVNVPNDSFTLIQNLSKKYPELKNLFDDIDSNLNQKLWYQLSENLMTLSSNPKLQQSSDLIEIYNGLIFFIEPTLNPMKYLEFVKNMLNNYKGKTEEALKFVENIENSHKNKYKGEEKIFIKILKGFCYYDLNRMYELEEIVKNTEQDFSGNIEIDSSLYSQYYKLSTLFYEKKQDYDNFYNNAFQYLAYETKMTNEEKLDLCYKMCSAMLIGEKLYNFAELIEKDFFKLMHGTQYEWISNLILSFNSAKVDQFLSMINQNKKKIMDNPILKEKADFLPIKIRIAALLDLIFQKNKTERTLSFDEICKVCQTEEDKIEYISMKALSHGLIKGYIDQVEKQLIVNWIQPKYLDKEKIVLMQDRFTAWIDKANRVLGDLQDNASVLLNN
jgi:26S proteasome regulatory subunit N9